MSVPSDSGSTAALAPMAGGDPVNAITFSLDRGQTGVWTLEAELDVGEATVSPSGAQSFTFAAPNRVTIAYACTVIEARQHIGRTTVFAVGGAGGLRSTLTQAHGSTAGIDYGEVRPRIVLEDILRDAHPVSVGGAPILAISERGDVAALAALDSLPHLPRWSRPVGTGRQALQRLVAKLSELTGRAYGWRVKRDGSVWVGVDTWPAYVAAVSPKDPPYYTAEPNARGLGTIALDAPDLDPGSTIVAPDDQGGISKPPATLRVSSVRYTIDESSAFRAVVTLAEMTPGARGREQDIRRRWVEGALPPLALRVPWFATVVSQDTDGVLGVRLEDGAPMLTLSGVPYWPGLPGCRVRVPMGVQCVVEFVGGREDRPIVRSCEPESQVMRVDFGGGDEPLARVGDSVQAGALAYAGPGALSVVPYGTPGAMNLDGVITSGAPKFRG